MSLLLLFGGVASKVEVSWLEIEAGAAPAELTVTPGAYTLSGESAQTLREALLSVTPGSFSVSGSNVTLLQGDLLTVNPGAYSLTGASAQTLRDALLTVTPGAYSVTGSNLSLLQGELLTVTPGSYAVTGSNVTLLANPLLNVTPGAYSLSGSPVELLYSAAGAELIVTPGQYTLTGFAVELEASTLQSKPLVGGKRRRYRLSIDGEEFEVRSPEEAQALLAQARQLAQARADTALERANKAKGRRKTEILKDARKALPEPRIEVDDQALQAMVQTMVGEISALYRSTLQAIEISALLRRVEQDEEDALLALML